MRNFPKPEVFIIGSTHSMHYNPDYHYSISDLLEQVRTLEPDVVCGEIAPEAYEQVTEGYFPPEAAFLAEMAPVLNYLFVPADWRLDFAITPDGNEIFFMSDRMGSTSIGRLSTETLQQFHNYPTSG